MPAQHPLIVDKLAFAVPVPRAAQSVVHDELWSAPRDGDLNLRRIPGYRYIPHYHVGCHLTLNADTEAFCTIHAAPRNPALSYLRLEFNPDRAGPTGYERIRDLFDYFRELAGVRIPLVSARITRIALAVDITGARPDQLFVNVRGPSRSAAFYNRGRTETMYFGQRNSAVQYLIYDKTAERRARAGATIEQRMRIEINIKRTDLRVSGLRPIANSFRNVDIAEQSLIREDGLDRRRIQFIDSCYRRGAHAAIRLYQGNREPRAWLRTVAAAPWWRPNQAIEDWERRRIELAWFFEYRLRARRQTQ